MRVRQPLAEAVVHDPGDHAALEPLLGLVAEELNVKEVVFAETAEELGGWRAKPNFKVLGPRLGPKVKAVAASLGRDDGTVAAALARGETVPLEVEGERIELRPDDVDLVQETLEGWGVAGDGRITVALQLDLTPELRTEGLARELVRVVQDARKAAALEVSDRIELALALDGDLAEALSAHDRAYLIGDAAPAIAVDLERTGISPVHAGDLDTAVKYFTTWDNPIWKGAVDYNLARVYEAQGNLDQAIKIYQEDESPQRPGNLLRSRRLRALSDDK